ncbi:type II toxin-antitoxin system RelE/ParE family toxin [Fluviibacterium sp. S390]|uniref:type II toxin-antitoxin system RelE/ParE family toxin n=1 Tax=Fluviibacterium sp. S390 TaxID=3415139 RepID=UPI003C7AD8AA
MIVEWSAQAAKNLEDIAVYVAQHNPEAARRLIDDLVDDTEAMLAAHPHAGRPGRVSGTREWVAHKSYVVAYRIKDARVQVLAVVHSARLWPDEFGI